MSINKMITAAFLAATCTMVACAQSASDVPEGHGDVPVRISKPAAVQSPALAPTDSVTPLKPQAATAAPQGYSSAEWEERYVTVHGKRTIQLKADTGRLALEPVNKRNCFIVMSKKDYYLYVYETRGADTVLLARYDCAFALRKGNKERQGDMKTPHCTARVPKFKISQIADAHTWRHDFKDGRGNILAYGPWFLRLDIGTSNRSIGIHGSTNNAQSVPGRASEGCIRMADADVAELKSKYCFVGMTVIIKPEEEGDRSFEVKAMANYPVPRMRNLNPAHGLPTADAPTAKAAPAKGKATSAKSTTGKKKR